MANEKNLITVVGDICLDVVGVKIPRNTARKRNLDNWQQTGETRTFYLPGGALLLQHFVECALKTHAKGKAATVEGPAPKLPIALTVGGDQPKTIKQFLEYAERLKRKEIVHSLLELNGFANKPDSKKDDPKTLRVSETFGFSGPDNASDGLVVEAPRGLSAKVLVIDDTGNSFRSGTSNVRWPACLEECSQEELKILAETTLVHKLHRPLPESPQTMPPAPIKDLWKTTIERFGNRRVVIVTVQDLRDSGVVISQGLSWERTALD
ncbi:MAG: hypothetical protein U0930_26695, partial [Pirellulales bacterium]